MDEQLRLTRFDELKPDSGHSSNLVEEAWHSFTNQSTTAIVAEVAVGAAVIALGTRAALSSGGKAAFTAGTGDGFRLATKEGVALSTREGLAAITADSASSEGRSLGQGIFFRRAARAEVGTVLEASSLPSDSNGLRAALEAFGGKAAEHPAATVVVGEAAKTVDAQVATIAEATSKSVGMAPRFKVVPLSEIGAAGPGVGDKIDFSHIANAMKTLPRTGFPRLE